MVEILKIKRENLKKIIEIAAKSIKGGKVLICPTDTVYGLIADATNERAVKKLFKIKKRKGNKAVPVFVKDLKAAKKLALIQKHQENFLGKVWPGKTTVVFKRKKSKVKLYGADRKTIALRVPKHKLINELLKKTNRPLTGTSANISGKPASTEIEKVISQFKNQEFLPDLILDEGNLKKSLPSTIIDLTKKKPKLLRRGEKTLKF